MDQELIANLYHQMLRIRRCEEEAARLYTERKIGGFLHLYIGQEALAVGTASVLKEADQVLTTYRCHGHYLARGGTCREALSELLGRETGCSKGRGGSMHFYDEKNAFYGGWAIIGGQIPLGAGFAFANKYQNKDNVCVCFTGDGGINIGGFHEGLALAALWKLPVVFVIENNYFSMGTTLDKTSPTEDLSIRALGYPMARDTVDGHDIFAVRSSMHAAVRRAREQSLPTLVEIKTYRYRGHSMADPAKYRTKEDVEQWKERDPISTLASKLDELGLGELRQKIDNEVEAEVKDAVEFAQNSPFPDVNTACDYAYSHYNY